MIIIVRMEMKVIMMMMMMSIRPIIIIILSSETRTCMYMYTAIFICPLSGLDRDCFQNQRGGKSLICIDKRGYLLVHTVRTYARTVYKGL